jgi:hypothetical protein
MAAPLDERDHRLQKLQHVHAELSEHNDRLRGDLLNLLERDVARLENENGHLSAQIARIRSTGVDDGAEQGGAVDPGLNGYTMTTPAYATYKR